MVKATLVFKKNDAIKYIKSLDKCIKIKDLANGFTKETIKKTIELLGIKNIDSTNPVKMSLSDWIPQGTNLSVWTRLFF